MDENCYFCIEKESQYHRATENQSDMMARERVEKPEGRCTKVCGDPQSWYPMRVTYGREMKVKGELERIGIESFLPMKYKVVESQINGDAELRRELVPAISNLIFVRSTQERVTELKRTNEVLEPLRYMLDYTGGDGPVIMTVGDREMENFMRVAAMTDDSVMFLDENTIVGKEGKHVKIMGGAFEGVEGVIRRVKRCKRVVVELEGIASVAIAHVPVGWLKEMGYSDWSGEVRIKLF